MGTDGWDTILVCGIAGGGVLTVQLSGLSLASLAVENFAHLLTNQTYTISRGSDLSTAVARPEFS